MNSESVNESFTEPGAANLRRALGQLPPHEPAPTTWARIEAQLAADAALPHMVAALPTHEPDADLWDSLASRLDAVDAATARRHTLGPAPSRYAGWLPKSNSGRRTLALVASLVLLVLASAGWWHARLATPATIARIAPAAGPRETLTVREETVDAALPASLPALPTDALETQGLAFIQTGCSRQPAVCSSAEFRHLNTQLAELQAEQQQLQQASRRFGNSPELAREQARLVNLQAAVTRQLINLLIS